jgi:opacity protein-like surface antigen
MTTTLARVLSAFALLALLSTPAFAQTPETGQIALGGDIGLVFVDEVMENSLALQGLGEYYFTPRMSGRVLLGWTSPEFDNSDDSFRQVKLLFNVAYNWEGGKVHPFVTAGTGFYFVRVKLDDRENDPDGETRGGLNFGGGAEFFLNRLTTIKAEGRWDIVSHPSGHPDATGFTLTVGLKRYF